jgi:hypothetical protein
MLKVLETAAGSCHVGHAVYALIMHVMSGLLLLVSIAAAWSASVHSSVLIAGALGCLLSIVGLVSVRVVSRFL